MLLFFDASSLLKLYIDESGSATMRALFQLRRLIDACYISDHIGLEVLVRLNKVSRTASRRERRAFRKRFGQFDIDRRHHLNILRLDYRLIAETETLAAKFADSGAGTLDLIHLASAFQVQRNVPDEKLVFVAADRKLRHVAERAGFRTFDPEQERPEDLGA